MLVSFLIQTLKAILWFEERYMIPCESPFGDALQRHLKSMPRECHWWLLFLSLVFFVFSLPMDMHLVYLETRLHIWGEISLVLNLRFLASHIPQATLSGRALIFFISLFMNQVLKASILHPSQEFLNPVMQATSF